MNVNDGKIETISVIINEEEVKSLGLFTLRDEKTVNNRHKEFWNVLKGMHKDFLYKDERWHFFFEGYFNVIRCSREYMDKVVSVLDEEGFICRDRGEWKDASKVVERYKSIFTKMFNSFSELAIDFEYTSGASHSNYDKRNELETTLDRPIHCVMNHFYYVIKELENEFMIEYDKEKTEYFNSVFADSLLTNVVNRTVFNNGRVYSEYKAMYDKI